MTRAIAFIMAVLIVAGAALAEDKAPAKADTAKTTAAKKPPAYETVALRGRVVFLAEALEKRHGVKSVDEAKDRALALETSKGELHPIVEDNRGRAFRVDKRLRAMDLELLVRRYAGAPAIQVISVYQLRDGAKYELDYWCEVCAISMVESKDCECCQAPNELRLRRVDAERN